MYLHLFRGKNITTTGGEKGRQLTKQEAIILNKPSVYGVGTTLVHLALRLVFLFSWFVTFLFSFQRTDVLCQLLTPANSDARKRLPSQSNADLASNIRHEVVAMLKVHKGDWPCVFASQMNTFFIPQGSCCCWFTCLLLFHRCGSVYSGDTKEIV